MNSRDVIKRRPRPYAAAGAKIQKLRKKAGGQSQAYFAEKAGISRRYWLEIESGQKLPLNVTRNKMAFALGCDPEEIQAKDDEDEESSLEGISLDEILRVHIRRLIREEAVGAVSPKAIAWAEWGIRNGALADFTPGDVQ